jgi:hypothetical protein
MGTLSTGVGVGEARTQPGDGLSLGRGRRVATGDPDGLDDVVGGRVAAQLATTSAARTAPRVLTR